MLTAALGHKARPTAVAVGAARRFPKKGSFPQAMGRQGSAVGGPSDPGPALGAGRKQDLGWGTAIAPSWRWVWAGNEARARVGGRPL